MSLFSRLAFHHPGQTHHSLSPSPCPCPCPGSCPGSSPDPNKNSNTNPALADRNSSRFACSHSHPSSCSHSYSYSHSHSHSSLNSYSPSHHHHHPHPHPHPPAAGPGPGSSSVETRVERVGPEPEIIRSCLFNRSKSYTNECKSQSGVESWSTNCSSSRQSSRQRPRPRPRPRPISSSSSSGFVCLSPVSVSPPSLTRNSTGMSSSISTSTSHSNSTQSVSMTNPNSTIRSLKSKLFSSKQSPVSTSAPPQLLPDPVSCFQPATLSNTPRFLLHKNLSSIPTTTQSQAPLQSPYPNLNPPSFRRNPLTRKSSFGSSQNGPRIIRLPALSLNPVSPLDHSLLLSPPISSFRPSPPLPFPAPKLSHLPHSANWLPQLAPIKPPTPHRPSSSPHPPTSALQLSPPFPPTPTPRLSPEHPPTNLSPALSHPNPEPTPEWLSLSPLVTQSAFTDLTALLEPPTSPPPPPDTLPASAASDDIDLEQARLIIQGLKNEVSLLKAKPLAPESEHGQDKEVVDDRQTGVESHMDGVIEPRQGREEQKSDKVIDDQRAPEIVASTDVNKLELPTWSLDAAANAIQPSTGSACDPPRHHVQNPALVSKGVVGTTEQVSHSCVLSSDKSEPATDERHDSVVVTPVKQTEETLAPSPSASKVAAGRQETSGKTTVKIEDFAPGLRSLLSPNSLTASPCSPRQLTPGPSRLGPDLEVEQTSAPVTPVRSRLPVPRRPHAPALDLGHARGGPSLASSGSTERRLHTPQSSRHRTPSTDRTTPSPRSPSAFRSPVQPLHHSHGRQLRSAAGRQWQAADWQFDSPGPATGEHLMAPPRQRMPHKLTHGLRSPAAVRLDVLPATMGHWSGHRLTHSAGLHSLFTPPSVESGGTEPESWFEELGDGLGRLDEGSVAGSSVSSQAERRPGGLKTMTKLELFLAASKQRARLASMRSAFAVERAALTEALEACREECEKLRRDRDRLVAENGWKRVELTRAREEVGWLSKTAERLEVERSRLETRANAMANELKRAVVDLRTVASAGVDGEGSSRGGSRIPVRVGSRRWASQCGEGGSGNEGVLNADSYSDASSATGRAGGAQGSVREARSWGKGLVGGSQEQSFERGSLDGEEEAESEEGEEEEGEGTGSSGLSPSSTVFADHDRTRNSRLVQMRNRSDSLGHVRGSGRSGDGGDSNSSNSHSQRGHYGWRDGEMNRQRQRLSVLSMEMLRPEDELFLENLVFGDGDGEGEGGEFDDDVDCSEE